MTADERRQAQQMAVVAAHEAFMAVLKGTELDGVTGFVMFAGSASSNSVGLSVGSNMAGNTWVDLVEETIERIKAKGIVIEPLKWQQEDEYGRGAAASDASAAGSGPGTRGAVEPADRGRARGENRTDDARRVRSSKGGRQSGR